MTIVPLILGFGNTSKGTDCLSGCRTAPTRIFYSKMQHAEHRKQQRLPKIRTADEKKPPDKPRQLTKVSPVVQQGSS
jgi:hypothetical protein